MNWLLDLYKWNPAAQALAVIAVVCPAGMVLGSVKVRGNGLGTARVLFAGLLASAVGEPIGVRVFAFVTECGLILCALGIGLQLGPGFIALLRGRAVRLNALGAPIVVVGAMIAAGPSAPPGLDSASIPGVFSGAATNNRSLGAAQQTVTDPSALAFASNMCGSGAPMTSYAAVYLLTPSLRILEAQILTSTSCGRWNRAGRTARGQCRKEPRWPCSRTRAIHRV
ncbi:MAG: hypothetical protein IT436_14645 [Phycisphaerales bacterium]|nr:hypothetical protein [Phycisphaerales bacterium]